MNANANAVANGNKNGSLNAKVLLKTHANTSMNANPNFALGGDAKASLHVVNGSFDADASPNTDINASAHASPHSVSDSTTVSNASKNEKLANHKMGVYNRLVKFCYIPLLLNLIFSITDLTDIYHTISRGVRNTLLYNEWTSKEVEDNYFRQDVSLIVKASTFLFSSITYNFGFALMFPAIRNKILCRSEEK